MSGIKKEQTETQEIQRFTVNNVVPTIELKQMSKKNMQKHIEYLEQVALSLDYGLVVAIEQLNVKKRAIDGSLV